MMIELILPFPPAVNNITAAVRGRKITSKRGRQYREDAVRQISAQFNGAPLTARLSVKLVLIPPCRRKRDIDNYSKAALDAITAAGVWVDDEQVDQLTIIRGEKVQGGGCLVQIEEMGHG